MRQAITEYIGIADHPLDFIPILGYYFGPKELTTCRDKPVVRCSAMSMKASMMALLVSSSSEK